MIYIGADISKKTFDVGLKDGTSSQYIGQFQNDQEGFNALSQSIKSRTSNASQVHLILEPTGGYERHLMAYGFSQNWLVSRPNPKIFRDWAKGSGKRAKTDPQDGIALAEYGFDKKPHTLSPMPAELEALEELLKRQDELQKLIRAEKNRYSRYLNQPRFSERVQKSLESILEMLEKELKEIESEIKELTYSSGETKQMIQRLLTIPGVGQRIVFRLYLFLAKWHLMTGGSGSSKALTAMIGLDPEPYQSGTSIRRRSTISKKGNHRLRELLFLGALGGVAGRSKTSNPLKAFYQRLVGRGKAKKLALVAAAHKIIIWAWAVFVNEVDFDPALAQSKS